MLLGWDAAERAKLRFFQGLASFYRATGDLRRAFDFLAREHATGPIGVAARGASAAIDGGATLDEALKSSVRGLDRVENGMLRVGERSGEVDTVLDALAGRLERRRAVRAQLIRRLAYPVFIVHAAGISLAFVALMGLASWLAPLIYFVVLYAVAVAGWLGYRRALTSVAGARRILRAPVVGSLFTDEARALFAGALALLYDAGVPLGESLDVAGDAVSWPPITTEVRAASRAVIGGGPLSGAIPPTLADSVLDDAIRVGEASGTLGETLTRAGSHYRERVERGRDRLITVTHAVVYAAAVIAVVYVALTVYGSYFARLV